MLPGPGGLTTDSGKNDTFTKQGLNDEITFIIGMVGLHWGKEVGRVCVPFKTWQ